MKFTKSSLSLLTLVVLMFSGCENPKKDIQADINQEAAVLKENAEKISYEKLISVAKEARENAYCPYSKFKVGAAVLTEKGDIYTGCNVENASYGLTICAERVAICKAVSAGDRNIKAIAVVLDSSDFGVPCGACRQFIYEFGKDIDVIMASVSGKYEVKKISELLPAAFELKK
jgi:cytidine deaminase